jgi:hypothetical protein
MPYDLRRLGLTDTLRCGAELRNRGNAARSVEEGAQAMAQFLYQELVDGRTGERACALVRCYATHAYESLPAELRGLARKSFGRKSIPADLRCLVLLGTAGDRPEWNDRRQSVAHQVIPLGAVDAIERSPMVAQMIRSFGIELSDLVALGDRPLRVPEGKTAGLFHVSQAEGSPFLDQDFVAEQRIESVLGFGGPVRSGELLAMLLFSRTGIGDDTATRFRTMALDMRAGLFAAGDLPTFRRET